MQEDNRIDGPQPGASDAQDRRCRRNGLPTQPGSTRGVSHVVGVLLMVAVTVLLVAFVGVMALGFEMPGNQPPQVATEGSFGLSSDGSGTPMVGLTHHSGDTVAVENVRIHITTDGGTVVKSVPTTGDLSDGTWSAGEDLAVPVETDDVCHGGEEANVRLVYHNDEGGTYTMAEKTVPLQASEFEIQGGSVVPEHDYNAKVEIVETEYTDGNDIEIQPIVGGDVKSGAFTPISQHTNQEPSQPPYVASDVPGGTAIRVRARSSNTQLSTSWVNSNDAGVGSQVWVRRDGESVPTNAGGGSQQDLEQTVSNYASNGKITLDSNQALYMYELYTDNPTSQWYEYQDAVVLVSFTSATGHPELVERDGTSRLVCPA